MKIVHCFFKLEIGGSQVLAIDLLNELCQSHEVSLLVVNDEPSETLLSWLDKRVTVYRINRKPGSRNPLPILHLNYLLARLNPDVVHCHERDLIRIIGHPRSGKLYTIHDVGVPTASFTKYDTVVGVSDAVAEDVFQRSGLRVGVIKNGIPFGRFRQRTDYRPDTGGRLRLVQVSRLMHEKKGQDILIEALAMLVNKVPVLNLSIDFIGSGPSENHLISLAQQLGVAEHVRFLGERDRTWLHQHLADYHALVLPSRYEGLPLVILEGFAAGLPVLASAIPGPAELQNGLPAGLLFERENAVACADAIRALQTAYERGHIASNVRQTRALMEQSFSIKTVVDNYLTIYERLLQAEAVAA